MCVNITFLGGTGTVTGSKYLVRHGAESLLVDCGLFQGHKMLRLRNWTPLAVAPDQIKALLLTHARWRSRCIRATPRTVRRSCHRSNACASNLVYVAW